MTELKDNIAIKTDNKKMFKKSDIDKFGKAVEITLLVLAIIYCISLLAPFFWMLINSFKTYTDYLLNNLGLPEKWNWSNYSQVFDIFKVSYKTKVGSTIKYGIDFMALYSILWTSGMAFTNVFLFSLCAFAFARYNFWGKKFLFSLGIIVMIVPIIGAGPSSMQIRRALNIYNNMLPLMLTSQSAAFSGLHFLLLYAAFKRIPLAYSEAVYIDGGGDYTVLFRVIIPMVLPSMVAVFVLQFLGLWSDYNTFIIWLPSYPSLSVGLYMFENKSTTLGISMPEILCCFVVVMVPTVLLYVITQNIIMSKFSVGGLKG